LGLGRGLEFRVIDDLDDRGEFRVKEDRQGKANSQANEEVDDEGAHGLEGADAPDDAIKFKVLAVGIIGIAFHPDYFLAGEDPIAIPFKGDLRAIADVISPGDCSIRGESVAIVIGGCDFASHLWGDLERHRSVYLGVESWIMR
jgi:hypothetical protein